MKTHKLKIELPTAADLVRGLTPDEQHPALPRARAAAAEAERALDARRLELADAERTVTELPAQIQAGRAPAKALPAAMTARDAAALLIAPAEQALARARAAIEPERKRAEQAVKAEFDRRASLLQRAVAEVAPVLEEINTLANALAGTLDIHGAIVALDWPDSPVSRVHERVGAGAFTGLGQGSTVDTWAGGVKP